MQNKYPFFLLFIINCLVFIGCNQNKQEITPNQMGYNFYPTDSGMYWSYLVRDITYGADTIDTTYHIKELIYDITSDANKTQAVIYVFKKATNQLNYDLQPDSVIVLNRTNYNLSRVENATEYVRLVFPITSTSSWNGNVMNIHAEDRFEVKNFFKPFVLPMQTFNNTLSVIEEDKFTLVDKDFRNIIYADNIGPIFSLKEFYRYKTEPSEIGLYLIDYGSYLKKELIAYGK
jgi:hypothetical protein